MSHLIPPGLDEADGTAPIEAPRWFAVFTQPKASGGRNWRSARPCGGATPSETWRSGCRWKPTGRGMRGGGSG